MSPTPCVNLFAPRHVFVSAKVPRPLVLGPETALQKACGALEQAMRCNVNKRSSGILFMANNIRMFAG